MNNLFKGWDAVARNLKTYAAEQKTLATSSKKGDARLNVGQQSSLITIAERLPKNGVVIADEVGMGKTRIAVEITRAVIAAGGRVVILVPPGLGYQWRDELLDGQVQTPPMVRSLGNFFSAWKSPKSQTFPVGPAQKDIQPWFSLPVVLVSHAFTDWRLSETSATWRWALLPELYARWRWRNTRRVPREYRGHDALRTEYVTAAAHSICDAIPDDQSNIAWRRCKELCDRTPWPAALNSDEYGHHNDLRECLESAVGLGLGVFDLVIVDEAHKSRGYETGLSRLLDSVIQRSPAARVVAMTATPVELGVGQWENTLSRIGADLGKLDAMRDAINDYADAVKEVRLSPRIAETQQTYKNAAANFQEQLSPFLLRRDKREDQSVMAFAEHTGMAAHNYRRIDEVFVDPVQLKDPVWRLAVCAAEALSLVSKQSETIGAKRLRLTIGNGHGIANVLKPIAQVNESDMLLMHVEKDEQAEDTNRKSQTISQHTHDSDRLRRAEWWHKVMVQAFVGNEDCLFDHPAILACVDAVEAATANNEKVLVFGLFTQPLRVLVELLNAREMLRCLKTSRPWPQAKIHDGGQNNDAKDDERPAVRAARRQLGYGAELGEINQLLARQYQDLENLRDRWRTNLLDKLAAGLDVSTGTDQSKRLSNIQQIFVAFRQSAQSKIGPTGNQGLALVGRAMLESLAEPEEATPQQVAQAFEQLINALTDRDEGDLDGDGELNQSEADNLWVEIETRLKAEYGRTQGSFARLMFGETEPNTRRLLQLAFNRPHSFPKVLVAQSKVGREGLNLHKACSTVILLHHEWNPGVVEQQIGRVDRVGSHWSKQLDAAIANKVTLEQFPRITIRPVIFKGTYDEYHWDVLRERWDDLRAQLNGVVIPPRLYVNDLELQVLAKEIEDVAPNFSPDNPRNLIR